MIHAIIVKFPRSVLDEQSQTLFVHLVACLVNDNDNIVRSMSGAAIKKLIGSISPNSLNSILDYALSWYLGGKQQLWGAAAQVMFSKCFVNNKIDCKSSCRISCHLIIFTLDLVVICIFIADHGYLGSSENI